MELSPDFIRECIQGKLESAVDYGIRRAYKHSDDKPPSDDQIEMIKESVTNALFEIFSWGDVGED